MKRAPALLLGFLFLQAAAARADIFVIVNPQNPLNHISAEEVANLYLGRSHIFPNGDLALIFDQPGDSSLHAQFFAMLTGMSQQRLDAYWSRLMFTGRVLPPQALPDDRAVLEIVRKNSSAIGYVRFLPPGDSVRAVLTLKE